MHHIPNPLLALLMRREERTLLTWRLIVILIVYLSLTGTVLLFAVMLYVEDYYVREDYESVFVVGYLLFIGLSLVMPLIMVVFSAILTTTWTSRDEKFDLLRLTSLPDRAFVRSYFFGALHRLRLLVALQAVLSFVSPMLVLVTVYWYDHPSGPYYYEDYSRFPLSVYLAVYGWMLLDNLALAGLSLIGVTLGVYAGLYYHSTTRAITGGVGATCGSYLVLAACVGCGLVVALTLVVPDTFFIQNTAGAFVASYFCIGTVCFVPLAIMWVTSMNLAQRAVRRD